MTSAGWIGTLLAVVHNSGHWPKPQENMTYSSSKGYRKQDDPVCDQREGREQGDEARDEEVSRLGQKGD